MDKYQSWQQIHLGCSTKNTGEYWAKIDLSLFFKIRILILIQEALFTTHVQAQWFQGVK